MALSKSQLKYYTGLGLAADLASDLVAVDQQLELPQRLPIPYDTNEATGWAGHYGGILELYRHAKGLRGLHPGFDATWQHGIVEPWRYQENPYQLLSGIKHPLDRLVLVATVSQRDVLARIGYCNVHAVGSPYAYAQPQSKPKRVSGSVLYMPAHSIDGSSQNLGNHALDYCDYLEQERTNGSKDLYVCLHMACLRNRFFWPTLRSRGIPIIAGADYCDGRAYRRMWHLFSRFETVSTNTLGSHIFYALAAGCRVKYSGPAHKLTEADLANDASFKRSVANGEVFMNNPNWKAKTESFLQSLSTGASNPTLGQSLIGLENVQSPWRIRTLLGWGYSRQMRKIPSLIRRQARRFRLA
jgi:hypothetical protein